VACSAVILVGWIVYYWQISLATIMLTVSSFPFLPPSRLFMSVMVSKGEIKESIYRDQYCKDEDNSFEKFFHIFFLPEDVFIETDELNFL
jgi:hypothetical protein